MISAVFFDFSGTVVESNFDVSECRRSVTNYLLSKGSKITLEDYSNSIEEVNRARVSVARATNVETTYEEFMASVLLHLGIEPKGSLIQEIEEIEFQNYKWNLVLGVRQVLKELSDQYKIGLISNAMTRAAMRVLEKENLLQYFDSLVFSRDAGFRKPHPAIFHYALNELDVRPRESVFVGDNEGTDALGASNVGMNAIWILHRKNDALQILSSRPFVCSISDIRNVPSAISSLEDSIKLKQLVRNTSKGVRQFQF